VTKPRAQGTRTPAQLGGEGGQQIPDRSAASSRPLRLLPPYPSPCSANLLPTFFPSILLNPHTRSALEMAAPTSSRRGSEMSQLPLRRDLPRCPGTPCPRAQPPPTSWARSRQLQAPSAGCSFSGFGEASPRSSPRPGLEG